MTARLFLVCIFVVVCFISPAVAQVIRTNMPVPPLQWLNLTGLTHGSPPPPLKDCAVGYDESTRSLVIFGGESQAGVPQQNTYLLDMDSLTWSIPTSRVPTMSSSPPARSRALGTGDFAANSRRDFLIYGGKGSNNEALGDVWAYDFLNQFWVNVTLVGTSPSPRWGMVGGIDPAQTATSDNGISTVFNIAGGSNSKTVFPSSELWQLKVTGTLASDLATIKGAWQSIPISSVLTGKAEAGGALISQSQATQTRIAISGGCGPGVSPPNAKASCADPSTYVLTVAPGSSPVSAAPCAVPRLGPAFVPNLNTASSAFASQSLLLLGTFDPSQWNDDSGLVRGEVAVLDVGTGTWARVLPAGDPAFGTPTFPTPRDGAAALSFPSALVGSNRASASDTIVFGGRDTSGSYSNELWVLRAYNSTLTQAGASWFGFGNGQLETGIDASGTGVSVQYLTQCARRLRATSTAPSASSTPGSGSSTGTSGPSSHITEFNVSVSHKLLSAISIALALPATIIVRLSSPVTNQSSAAVQHRLTFLYAAFPTSLVAYFLGVAGFATSLTSTSLSHATLQRRTGTSSDTFLKTVHGQAGLALFVGLYGIIPLLALGLRLFRVATPVPHESRVDEDTQAKSSQDTAPFAGEKDIPNPSIHRAASPARSAPEVPSSKSSLRDRRQRTHSGPGLFPGWHRDQESSENSEHGATPSKGFEVMNRPRRASGGAALYPPRDFAHRPRTDLIRSLNDISWLDRRRSVGAVGDLDYALSQLGHTSPRSASPPVTSRPPTATMSTRPFVRTPTPTPTPSSAELGGWDILLHILFHAFLLANCILVLVALFSRAPIATFIAFLIWTLAFYFCLLLLAWHGRPRASLLVTVVTWLRNPVQVAEPKSPLPGSPVDEHSSQLFPPSIPGGNPYIYHSPLWRRATSIEEDITARAQMLDRDDPEVDDEDEDDDERQRRMEEELERRDVNIVTVPKRKLWITNPS